MSLKSPEMEKLKVCVIGAGGNSSLVSLLLSHHGVRGIKIVDGDTIEQTNLDRQVLFGNNDIGQNKAIAMTNVIKNQGTFAKIEAIPEYLDSLNYSAIVGGCDLIIDCTDSILTRNLINEISASLKIPWLMTSSLENSLELKLIVPGRTACLNCLSEGQNLTPINCSYDNVEFYVPSLASILGVSILVNYYKFNLLEDCIYFYDSKAVTMIKIQTSKRDSCKVCSGKNFPLLDEKHIIGRSLY
ncbi:MAG: HesA/MoeB/ThiF family protein [Thermoplasmataceae archaeon]